MESENLHPRTQAIHAGTVANEYGAVAEPIYRTSTYSFTSIAESQERAELMRTGDGPAYYYSRLGNPTNAALERRLAALEHAEAAVVTGAGMGAISSVMWTFLKAGDHLIADTALYGETHGLFADFLTKFGVEVEFVDLSDLDALGAALRPQTAMVYLETPCNPTMKINDIAAIAAIVHADGRAARVVVDNTFASPYLQNPLLLGADLVVHSMTKYLGGHSDVVAGCVCGGAEDIAWLRYMGVARATGSVLAADSAYLAMRGIATLPVRMEAHCDNAERIAAWLVASPHVATVHYPGLASHPGHEIAARQMRRFGGMLAVELALTQSQTEAFVDALRLARIAVSLGGVETLVEHPAGMTHQSLTAEQLAAAGIPPSLLRFSIGIEDPEDLIADLEQAFARALLSS
jgi:methionine-gamma-lyase